MPYRDTSEYLEHPEPEPKPEGFPFGNRVLPVGTLVEVREHEGCLGSVGQVKLFKSKKEDLFSVVCDKCGKIGVSVIRLLATG